ncbi:MAG: hypothetical protein ACUVXJ_10920 [Phycisphaerae bacterium]
MTAEVGLRLAACLPTFLNAPACMGMQTPRHRQYDHAEPVANPDHNTVHSEELA